MSRTYFLNELADSISSLNTFSINQLSDSIGGKIYGSNDYKSSNGFHGIFETLNDAKEGDIVIRHWINSKGIEIANNKKVACIITLTPKEDALKTAEKLHFPVIVVDRIEFANAFAIKWTIDNLVPNSKRIVISGTNGKSTTSHMIYHILSHAGYNVFTNTDAKSEFNTLIDPMISKLIAEEILFKQEINPRTLNSITDIPNKKVFDYLVIEVSEVQGWGTNLMKNHALIMSSAINPDVSIVTNVTMDHIGLVNSIKEIFEETSGVIKATNKGGVVLNFDDKNVLNMKKLVKSNIKTYFTSMNKETIETYETDINKKIYFDNKKKTIIVNGNAILKFEELPFTGNHFIKNILSSISACLSLNIPIKNIKEGIKSYIPLNRRFTKLHDAPIIIDDFAHNPDGIKNTIKATYDLIEQLNKNDLYIACAIRGSRGKTLNSLNSKTLAKVIKKLNHKNDNSNKNRVIHLNITSSIDLVDYLNHVENFEKNIFFTNLDKENIKYKYFEKLYDTLEYIIKTATKNDVILLIGAQGMDSASEILHNILY